MTTQTKPSPRQFNVIGTRPIRHDGLDKVTGRAKYGADVSMPSLLHCKILRSPHPHARIRSIDTSKALAHPGVKAVITGQDFPALALDAAFIEVFENMQSLARNVMARDKALYKGHAVAAVAATTPHIAEEALALIHVDYDVLPTVLDPVDAMKDGAPILHEDILFGPEGKKKPSNIASHAQIKKGDIAQGFKDADVIVEQEFRTKAVHQGYIEPHNSTAYWAPDDQITMWKSTQAPFIVRSQAASILNLPVHRIKVVPMEIGGGFGGKIPLYTDPVVALLSKKAGHPVKYVMTRKETFESTGPTSGSFMRGKIGAKKDGTITAAEFSFVFEAGAFPGSPVGTALATCLGPYQVPHVQADGYDVVVNKPKVAAYRAPGAPIGAFPVETLLDEIAQKLSMDPMQLRLKNASKSGDRDVYGMTIPVIGGVDVQQAVVDHPHYKAKLTGPNRGRGVAIGYWFNAGLASSATVTVNFDGTVGLVTGSVDIGGTRTACAMQVAEVLGIRAHDVSPSVADTDSVGYTSCTGGSRTAFSTGLAAIGAAEKVIHEMSRRAAMLWEMKPSEVEFSNGTFTSKKDAKNRFTFVELASKLMDTGGPVTAAASVDPRGVGPTFGALIVDVEVDTDTGKVAILRCTSVIDAGKAAHPGYVEGQMQGGAVQGIGWALNEEYYYNPSGAMDNASFLDYRMPTSLDVPMIDTQIVEIANPGHPFGLRGVGEIPLVPPMAAIANAVSRAIGIRMTELPMSPGKILAALAQRNARK